MKLNNSFFLLIIISLSTWHCGHLATFSDDPFSQQPSVDLVEPTDGTELSSLEKVSLHFSSAVDAATVQNNSFLIFQTAEADLSALNASDVLSTISAGDIRSIEGIYVVSDHAQQAEWRPKAPLVAGVEYTILVTSDVQTSDHYPLNQTPGASTTLFVSHFTLLDTSTATTATDDSQTSDATSISAVTSSAPASLVLNEIYYDDTQSDTDGHEFVELFGTPGSDIGGYSLRFINGSDGTQTDEIVFSQGTLISADGFFVVADTKTGSSSETYVANADFLNNFDPQNGPDSIQLLNTSGFVIDVVGYGSDLPDQDESGNNVFEGTSATDVTAGQSLSRVSGVDTNNNFSDWFVNLTPSPGTGDVQTVSVQTASTDTTESTDSTITSSESEQSSPSTDTSVTSSVAWSAPSEVYFTEVVTDPQQDWNDTSGGDGIAFDNIPGNGTVGSTDEWIEIKNGRGESVNLSGWSLQMLDGTDQTLSFDSSTATFIFSEGGSVSNFQADEYLTIGNPEGDIKNTVSLALYDDQNTLVDSVSITDGNADSPSDESYQLGDDGTWNMGEATIGF